MKLTPNLTLSELADPEIIEVVGDRAADFLHPELAPTLQRIRDRFGALIVNGVYRGQTFAESGLRHPKSRTGAKLSAHRFGCAADFRCYGATPQEIQEYIVRHQSEFPSISRMEHVDATPTWNHIEVTGKRVGNIYIFKP